MEKSSVETKLREKELQNKLNNNETFTYEEWLELRNFIEIWIRGNLFGIDNFMFKITDDFKINGDGNVIISAQTTELPYKFGIINGDFNMSNFKLTSLKNTPDEVDGAFNCSNLELFNLKGGPKKVKSYIAVNCSLNTLIGFDTEVTGYMILTNNNLVSLEGCPYCPSIVVNNNQLTSIKHLPDGKYKTLEFIKNLISEIPENKIIATSLNLNNNKLTSLKNMPKVTVSNFNIIYYQII